MTPPETLWKFISVKLMEKFPDGTSIPYRYPRSRQTPPEPGEFPCVQPFPFPDVHREEYASPMDRDVYFPWMLAQKFG